MLRFADSCEENCHSTQSPKSISERSSFHPISAGRNFNKVFFHPLPSPVDVEEFDIQNLGDLYKD